MDKYSTSRVMPFTAQQMFNMVVDIEQYPQFVPICKKAEIGPREDLGDGTFAFDSLLVFRFKKFGIFEEFRSRVTCDPENYTVNSWSDGPPFKEFRAVWSFEDVGEKLSEAHIDVSYQFRSRALGMFISRGAGIGIERLIQAWDARAHEIYGGVAA
ncbi:MAG: type II toxin-antitoxin system RatA family toxin [Pseudomonadota bacterium]